MLARRLASVIARLALGAAALALAPGSRAAETEPVRLEYRAARGCPSAERFSAEVFQRAGRARPASAGEPARTFVIVIERTARAFEGGLSIRDERGETPARRVTGARCDELAGALALSTALAVDPTALTTPSEPLAQPTPAERSPSEPRSEADGEARPRVEAAHPETEAEAEAEDDAPADPFDDVARSSRPRAHWSTSLLAGPRLRTGNSPRPALGGAVGLATRAPDRLSPFAGAGVELAVLRSFTESVNGASSALDFWVVRPELCVLAARPSAALRLAPCVVAELGVVRGRGWDLPEPATEHRFWAAAELALRAELSFSERALLALGAGPIAPLTRYRFAFLDPHTSIYDVPLLGFSASAQLGIGW